MKHQPTDQDTSLPILRSNAALLTLALCLLFAGCMPGMGQPPTGEALELLEQSPRWRDGHFVNDRALPIFDLGRFDELVETWWTASPSKPEVQLTPAAPSLHQKVGSDGLRITWVGHSTMLVEMDGVRILTDPIWSERCAPVSFAGPRRFSPPGLPLSALGRVDAVVISHDHYDHLDHATVLELAATGTTFFVPLGVGSHLSHWGVRRYVELDWWEQATVQGTEGQQVALIATPAQHFSGRSLTDRNQTLWASWAFVGPRSRVYFGGDTGYFSGFQEIGRRLGPFDVTLMPIGAYHPMWSSIHLNPEEAVQAHLDLKGRRLIPVHWATFDLSVHPWQEPAERLLTAIERAGVSASVPRPGQTVSVGRPASHAPPRAWWRDPSSALSRADTAASEARDPEDLRSNQ